MILTYHTLLKTSAVKKPRPVARASACLPAPPLLTAASLDATTDSRTRLLFHRDLLGLVRRYDDPFLFSRPRYILPRGYLRGRPNIFNIPLPGTPLHSNHLCQPGGRGHTGQLWEMPLGIRPQEE